MLAAGLRCPTELWPLAGPGFCCRICTGTSESRLTAHYSLLTANSSYTFSAKEKDTETGLSYFGSRYYSSDLSIWLSVDPMSDKYPSLSPYTYCADNPVKLVDPNGEEVWIPDEDGNLIAQENDDYKNFNMEKLAVFIISVFCSIHLCLASDTLYLRSNEFSVVRDDYIELYIRIISPNAIEIINTTPDLTICFKVDKKNYVAKGTYWHDSSTPSGCNCTFLKTQQFNLAVMNNDTLQLVKTPPDKKKQRAWKQKYMKYKPAIYFQYDKRYQDHNFYFGADGSFVEYQWHPNSQDVTCEKGWIISWGSYEVKQRHYNLNSNQSLARLTQDTIVLTDVQSRHVPQDSLFITLHSPYLQLLSYEDTCKSCKYRHRRIFSYDFIIVCGDDKINKEYEKAFNSEFVADTTGVIRVAKPNNVHLKSILIKVRWKVDHLDTVIIQARPSRVLMYELDDRTDNDLILYAPTLDYTFLTRIYYHDYKLRRKGRKCVVWQDKMFKQPIKFP